ncbi:cytochrome P450 [Gloeopeniophorella convolvens]|nr:cytochrome P450 [Gloeopeniophorella convolvens]
MNPLALPLPSAWLSMAVIVWAFLVQAVLKATYNMLFHPLARFPGPRGAACTRWWLAYMELWKGASLSDLRAELHEKYGDVVRVGPNELHFANPGAFHEIYNAQNKWDKDYSTYGAFDMDESFFTKTDYAASKRNRALVSNMFSKKAISELQHLVRSKLDVLSDALKAQHDAGISSDLYRGFQCFAADMIASFCFATSFNQLAAPDFRGEIVEAVGAAMPTWTLRKYSRFFVRLLRSVPHWALERASPVTRAVVIFKRGISDQINSILADPSCMDSAPHRTVYRELLNPEANKGRGAPSALQLQHEAEVLFSAGSHTISVSLMVGTYHLLHNLDVKKQLADELHLAWPVSASLRAMRRSRSSRSWYAPRSSARDSGKVGLLLDGVIKETLRLAPASTSGLPRVTPPSGAIISGIMVPGGAIVSQSSLFVLLSADIFTRPREFVPIAGSSRTPSS